MCLFSHSDQSQESGASVCPLKMMDEMSVTMCYDAHSMEQMSEEEILACLVAETGPTFTVRNRHWAVSFHHWKALIILLSVAV